MLFDKLRDLNISGDHHLQPLDVVLFLGKDPVAKFIRSVERHATVPSLLVPFNQLWTHAGILVDKSVLDLPFLEEGKLYLYESIFSGTVAGYVYSKVLPIDHPTKQGGFHLGPQIRDFAQVVDEVDSDVGIFSLTGDSRAAVHRLLKERPNLILDFYNKYKDCSYPLFPLKQIAAADDHLFSLRDMVFAHFPQFKGREEAETAKAVFCSELVALLLRELELPTFANLEASKVTPVELDVAPEFGNRCLYAKEDGKVLVHSSNKIPTGGSTKFFFKFKELIENVTDRWEYVAPGQPLPSKAVPVGSDEGKDLYIVRAHIGGSVHPGKIVAGADKAHIAFEGAEMKIGFGHEVLVNFDQLKWIEAKNGEIPSKALRSGFDEDGKDIFIVRSKVESSGFLGLGIGSHHAVVPGKISPGSNAATVGFRGKEVSVKIYEVLCHE